MSLLYTIKRFCPASIAKSFALEHRNMVANFSAKVITMLISIVLVPLYLHILGHEAYGLVSFQVVLLVVFSFLELGLPATITREMGRRDDFVEENYYPNLICTIERVIWGVGLVVVIAIAYSSKIIAVKWLQAASLPMPVVVQALMIMGGTIAIQFSSLVYAGGLRGLEKQVLLGLCSVVSAVVRGFGVLLLLWLIAPDVRIFAGWHLAVAAVEIIFFRYLLYAYIPGEKKVKPIFRFSILKQHWGFSSKIILNSVVLSIASQVDKLAISKSLTLEHLGYYAIAGTAVSVITVSSSAIVLAVYPKLCRTFVESPTELSTQYYIRTARLLGMIIWPTAFFLFFFSWDVLLLWTQDNEVAQKAHWALSFLAVSVSFAAMAQLPIYLSLATAKLKYMLLGNLSLALLNAPLVIICVLYWGLPGAAAVLMGINLLYCIAVVGMIHHDVLGGGHLRWWYAMLLPAVTSFVVAAALHSVIPIFGQYFVRLCLIGVAFLSCYIAVVGCYYIVNFFGSKQISKCFRH